MDMQQLEALVKKYQDAVHSQNKSDFYALWSKDCTCSLISISTQFVGIDNIYQDFLIGRIQQRHSSINLINDHLDIRIIEPDLAIIVFQYHTETILRETGLPGGIQGVETQIARKENNEWKLLHVHYSKI